MPKAITIKAKIQWRVLSDPGGRSIGVCDVLNIALEARSDDELRTMIDEAMQLFLLDLLEDNELDEYLKAHGWTRGPIPEGIDPGDVSFHVPVELIAGGQVGLERSIN